MVYEIEKRAKVDSKDYERVKLFLDSEAELEGEKEMKSFLFRNPDYLRVRLINGQNEAIITHKSGSYEDKARKETEFLIKLEDVKDFVEGKIDEGYNECSIIQSKRISYLYHGLAVELNNIDSLGLMVEVEGITENEEEIDEIREHIDEVFEELDLRQLPPKEYQRLVDEMYSKKMNKVDLVDFSI